MPSRSPILLNCTFVQYGDVFQCDTCGMVTRDPIPRLCEVKYDPHADPEQGVGTELAKVLQRFGIHPRQGCSCKQLQAEMNSLGPDACEARLDEIAEQLQQQATRRGWLFADSLVTRSVAKRVVAYAIRQARALPPAAP